MTRRGRLASQALNAGRDPRRCSRCTDADLWISDSASGDASHFYFLLPSAKVGCHPAPFWLGAAAMTLIFFFLGFLGSRLLFCWPLAISTSLGLRMMQIECRIGRIRSRKLSSSSNRQDVSRSYLTLSLVFRSSVQAAYGCHGCSQCGSPVILRSFHQSVPRCSSRLDEQREPRTVNVRSASKGTPELIQHP